MAVDGSGLGGTLTAEGHRLPVRVYYADTDFSGVVYHARYLEFLERGRSEFVRSAGIGHAALAEDRIFWVVRRMEIDFRASARMDDLLEVDTHVERVAGARIVMRQEIRRSGALLIEARVELAVLSPDGRPRRFPPEWAAALTPRRLSSP